MECYEKKKIQIEQAIVCVLFQHCMDQLRSFNIVSLKNCGSGFSAITLLINLSCKSYLFFSEIGHKYEV